MNGDGSFRKLRAQVPTPLLEDRKLPKHRKERKERSPFRTCSSFAKLDGGILNPGYTEMPLNQKSGRPDSNRRMLAWKANALPLGDARALKLLFYANHQFRSIARMPYFSLSSSSNIERVIPGSALPPVRRIT